MKSPPRSVEDVLRVVFVGVVFYAGLCVIELVWYSCVK